MLTHGFLCCERRNMHEQDLLIDAATDNDSSFGPATLAKITHRNRFIIVIL